MTHWKISTHTLTWSVTSAASVIACAGKYFNSHAHVERDQSGIELAFAKDISTHTLTWSVTRPPSINMRLSMYFNSHAHVERDLLVVNYQIFTNISTHTLTWSVTGLPTWRFLLLVISTHTLTWSVTLLVVSQHREVHNFNSHAHVERDYERHSQMMIFFKFQLTRSRGA